MRWVPDTSKGLLSGSRFQHERTILLGSGGLEFLPRQLLRPLRRRGPRLPPVLLIVVLPELLLHPPERPPIVLVDHRRDLIPNEPVGREAGVAERRSGRLAADHLGELRARGVFAASTFNAELH